MKNQKLVLVAALAVAFGSSIVNAGTLTAANTSFAAENFGGTFAATTAIKPGAVSYSMSAATNVNAGATIYFVVRLSGAKFSAIPAFGTIGFAGAAVANGAPSGATPGYTGTISTDGTTLQVAITNGSGVANLGLGAFSYTPAATDIIAVGGLATVGATVNAAVSVTTIAAASAGALDSTNAIAATLDAPLPNAAIATSVAAISGSVSNLPTYTNQIDLTATPPSSDYVLRTVGVNDGMALGSVTFTTTAGRKNLGGTVDYTLELGSTGAGAAGATITVTPSAGQTFPVGSVLSYDKTSSGCIGANQSGALPAVTALTAGAAKTLTVVATDVTTAIPVFVCMTKPSATNTATPLTVALTAATVPFTSTDAVNTTSGTGYAVNFNGSQVDVQNYIPLAVTGYQQTIRVINTGTVPAIPSIAVVNEATGVVSSAVSVGTSIPVGGSLRLSQGTIEGLIGAQAATVRPRLRITAPTNGMRVQSLFNNANGAYTNLSGQE